MPRPKVLISVPTGDGWIHKTVLVAFTRLNLETAGCEVTGIVTQYAGVENNRHIIRKQFLEGPWDYWLSMDEAVIEGRKKAQAKAQDPERRRKIADAKRGKPRPMKVLEALRAANVGRKLPQAQRAKMSKAHKHRGTIPPKAQGRLWTAEDDEAVRTLPVDEAAAKTGRTVRAVYMRRFKLGIPDAREGGRKKSGGGAK